MTSGHYLHLRTPLHEYVHTILPCPTSILHYTWKLLSITPYSSCQPLCLNRKRILATDEPILYRLNDLKEYTTMSGVMRKRHGVDSTYSMQNVRGYHVGGGGVGHEPDINKRRRRTACVSSVSLNTFFYALINFCFQNTL